MAVEPMATNNRDYWAERALTRENEAYLRGANLSGKMFREYEAAAKSIRRQIDSFYSKYAGTEVKLDDVEYIVVRQNDILAIVE